MPTKLIGTGTNQVPTNGNLGTLAFQNRDAVSVEKLSVGGAIPTSTQLYVEGDAELTQALNGSAQIVRVKNNHVGNSSPARLIIQTRGWTDSDAIINLDAAATNARWTLGADAAAGKFVIANADLNNFTGSSEVFQIDGATGNATFSGDVSLAATKNVKFADDCGVVWVDNKITGSNTHDTLYFHTGGSEQMRLNSSGLAIGTSATAVANSKFEVSSATHVLPTATVTADDQVAGWRTRRTGGSYAHEWYTGMRENDKAFQLYDNTNNACRLHVNTDGHPTFYGQMAIHHNVPFLKLKDNTSAGATFQAYLVGEDSAGTIRWRMGRYDATHDDVEITNVSGSDIKFLTNNDEVMRLVTGGAVGIGTSDPADHLEISGTSNSTSDTFGLRIHNNSLTTNASAGITFQQYDNVGAWIRSLRTGSSAGTLVFGTNNGDGTAESNVVEALRLASDGDATFAASATFGPGGTGTDRIKVTADGGTGTAGGGLFEIRQNGAYIGGFGNEAALDGSGTSSDLEIRAAAGIPIVLAPNNVDCLTLATTGAATFAGSLSKGSGSFKIDHPLPAKKDTHHLVHSFIEGPQADLIYRGRATLSSGSATVDIDAAAGMTSGTFEALCRDIQCFTSNEAGWTAVRGSVSGATLTIEAQDADCTDTISWMVVGERKDQHIIDTDWTDDDGKVIVEPEKPITE